MKKLVKYFLMMVWGVSLAMSVHAYTLWEKLNHRVDALYRQGLYSEAAKVAEEALKTAEEALDPDHPQMPAEVKPIYEKALAIAELFRAQGRYAEAEPLFKRVLAIDEKVLGKDHPDVARDLNNLALLYHAQGMYAEAEPLYERALAIGEKSLGPDHPQVATLLNNQAELFRAQGMYAEAEPLYERALAIEEKALGPGHPQVATEVENTAKHYEKLESEGKAEKVEDLTKQTRSQVSVSPTEVGPKSEVAEDKKQIKERASKSQKPSKAIFTVQVGAFRNASYAKALMTWLRGKGYNAYIILSGSKEGEKLYRVCIGRFVEKEKAKTLSEKIKNSEGLQTFVTLK